MTTGTILKLSWVLIAINVICVILLISFGIINWWLFVLLGFNIFASSYQIARIKKRESQNK